MLSAAQSRLEPTAAGRVWRQLSELGFINSSLQFAAAFTLGFIPFLMVLSAALGPGLTRAIALRSGFSGPAARDLAVLFTHARTASATVTALALALAVLGGAAVAHMVQTWYAKAFRAQARGWKAMARRVQWLAGVLGFLVLQAVIGRRIQPHGGDIAAASAQFLLALVFWWWSLHTLLSGQIPWRRLFTAGLATAVCYTGLDAYIACVMSPSIVANQATYGPIGTVITLLSAETGLAVALQLGAAIGATTGRGKDPEGNQPTAPKRKLTKEAIMALHLPPLAAARRRAAAAPAVDEEASPTQTADRAKRALALTLLLAITAVGVAQYSGLIPIAWLAVGPLLASLVLSVRTTAALAGWSMLLGLGLTIGVARPPQGVASHLGDMVLLAGFAVANAVLLTAAKRRLSQVRAVALVAQGALLREVPASVTAGRLASRYVSAAAEARVGGDLLEVIADESHPRWLIGDTRGKGLPAVRLGTVAMTSFRDACAQPGLSLAEIARAVDRSVTRAAGEEDFVTAVFAELDPRGWLQLVTCGHPPPLRLTAQGGLQPLTPRAYTTPLGLHPDTQPSTFTINPGDRLVFYTDGLLEARDQAGRYFRLEDCAGTLRHPDLQAAADGLLSQLRAHTGRQLDDDVTVLLLEATSPAGHEPGGHLIPASTPGTLKSTCRKCGKSITKLAQSRGTGTPPDRSSWMTNDSDGDAICHAPAGGMPPQPHNDAEVVEGD